jgi:hypothetical protein
MVIAPINASKSYAIIAISQAIKHKNAPKRGRKAEILRDLKRNCGQSDFV